MYMSIAAYIYSVIWDLLMIHMLSSLIDITNKNCYANILVGNQK